MTFKKKQEVSYRTKANAGRATIFDIVEVTTSTGVSRGKFYHVKDTVSGAVFKLRACQITA